MDSNPDSENKSTAAAQERRSRLLVVGLDLPDNPDSWPTIRTWRLITRLPGVDVTVALPASSAAAAPAGPIRFLPYGADGVALQAALGSHDAVVVHSFALHDFPFLARAGLPLIVDLGVPFLLERLEVELTPPSDAQRDVLLEELRILNELLRAGDFFVCGSETKRDFWLGMLFANHRVNPHTLAVGSGLRHLIDVAPDAPEPEGEQDGPLAAFCACPRRSPDQGLYFTDLERVAEDRAAAIESLLEFNYWHQSSIDRGGAIEHLEGRVQALETEIERPRQGNPEIHSS
jgi:hypothetical protein